jgi:hypothetical protein
LICAEKDLKMTRGTINSVPSVNGDDLDETEDGLSEITSKKNRERFAINKSYSIEVIFRFFYRMIIEYVREIL